MKLVILIFRDPHSCIKFAFLRVRLPIMPGTRNTKQGYAELGKGQFCHDNVTMFSGHNVVIYCNITVFVWLLQLNTEI